jgi:hypothetical protein
MMHRAFVVQIGPLNSPSLCSAQEAFKELPEIASAARLRGTINHHLGCNRIIICLGGRRTNERTNE